MRSLSHHIMPLVINSLGANTYTNTHTHTDVRTETILGNQAHAWFKNGSKPSNLARKAQLAFLKC